MILLNMRVPAWLLGHLYTLLQNLGWLDLHNSCQLSAKLRFVDNIFLCLTKMNDTVMEH